ncbi:MAG: cell envelope integrity protein TolA [Lentisphaerota bacterium]
MNEVKMKKRTAFIFKNCILASISALLMLSMSSCAVWDWFMAKTSDDEVDQMDKDISGLGKRVTRYEDSLDQFGIMLEAYDLQKIRIQSKPIRNQTAEKGLPDDIRVMVETSINKIRRQITLIPYDPVYYTAEVTTGGQIVRTLPDIVIDGGLSEFDKDMIEKERELKAEAEVKKGDWGSKADQDGGAGYKAKSGISRLGLDLHLLNYSNQSAIAGKQASNTVNIRKTQLGWSVGYYFQGCGLSFEYTLKKQQGLHSAIRLLVEMSVMEILGKYYDVPYWRCIEGAKPDEPMCARLSEEFTDASDATQVAYLKEYLFLHGYDSFDRNTNSFDQAEAKSFNDIMAKLGAANKTDMFMKLWMTVPIEEAKKRLKEARRGAEQQRTEQIEAQKRANAEALKQQQMAESAQQKAVEQKQAEPPPVQQKAQPQTAPPQPVAPAAKKPATSSKEKPVGFGAINEF